MKFIAMLVLLFATTCPHAETSIRYVELNTTITMGSAPCTALREGRMFIATHVTLQGDRGAILPGGVMQGCAWFTNSKTIYISWLDGSRSIIPIDDFPLTPFRELLRHDTRMKPSNALPVPKLAPRLQDVVASIATMQGSIAILNKPCADNTKGRVIRMYRIIIDAATGGRSEEINEGCAWAADAMHTAIKFSNEVTELETNKFAPTGYGVWP